MAEREFPVTFDPKRGALVDLPTVCPLCASHVGPSYDVHMVMAHPETRPRPDWIDDPTAKKPKGKKRR
jgi:hypothetical protein